MNRAGSCLAIDYGTKRCGLARSDPNRVLSTGLPTFERRPGRSFHAHLRELLAGGDYSLVVLGYPHHEPDSGWEADPLHHMDPAPSTEAAAGTDGAPVGSRRELLIAEIRSLAGWIERETGVPITFWDESLTSFEAERRLQTCRKNKRRDKSAIDRRAAEILLQEFLDAGCPLMDAGPGRPEPGSEP